MQPLPHAPKTFRDLVVGDLRRAGRRAAARLVAKIHPDPIDPQFRIASPEGDWWIAITLPDKPAKRQRRMVAVFMAWKLAPSFILASELAVPDCVLAMGVSHRDRIGCLSVIARKPLAFGTVEWLSPDQLGDEIPALLPRGRIELSAARLAELEAYFGPTGAFPAVKIETGEVGDETSAAQRLSVRS